MSKIFLFIALLFVVLGSYTQNWQPLRLGETWNYQHSDSQTVSHPIWVDSVGLSGSDSIFHLNRIAQFVTSFPVFDYEYYLVNTPHFLNKTMRKKNTNEYVFENPGKFTLKPLSGIGQSWVFDSLNSIQASVINILPLTIFSQQDSIKVIQLSNNHQIVLSKNYGIYAYTTDSASYQLMGMQNQKLGTIVPTYREIFDFQVGDVFYYEFDFNCYCTSHSFVRNEKIRQTVLQRTDFVDSIRYEMKKEVRRYGIPNQDSLLPVVIFSVTYSKSDSGAVYADFMPLRFFSTVHTYTRPGMFFLSMKYGRQQLIKQPALNQSGDLFTYNTTKDTIWISKINDGVAFESMSYVQGLGLQLLESHIGGNLMDQTKRYELVGWIKGVDTTGTVLNDFHFTDITPMNHASFKVYPNPSTGAYTLDLYGQDNPNKLYITDVSGKIWQEIPLNKGVNRYDFSLENIDSGVYFMHIQFENGRILHQTIIKQ